MVAGEGGVARAAWEGRKQVPKELKPELRPEGRSWPGQWGEGRGRAGPGAERSTQGKTRAGVQSGPEATGESAQRAKGLHRPWPPSPSSDVVISLRSGAPPPSQEKAEDRNRNLTREPFPSR